MEFNREINPRDKDSPMTGQSRSALENQDTYDESKPIVEIEHTRENNKIHMTTNVTKQKTHHNEGESGSGKDLLMIEWIHSVPEIKKIEVIEKTRKHAVMETTTFKKYVCYSSEEGGM